MGELPALIKGVPEASLPKPEIKSEPSREYFIKADSLVRVGANVSVVITEIPDDSVFEVRYIGMSAVNTGAPAQLTCGIGSALIAAGGGGSTMMQFLLDHNEHQVSFVNIPPLTILVTPNLLMRAFVNGSPGGITWIVSGFFIKKSEIALKTEIIL